MVKPRQARYNRTQESSCVAKLCKLSCYTTLSLAALTTAIIAGIYYQPEMAAKYLGEENLEGLQAFAKEHASKEWLESVCTLDNLKEQSGHAWNGAASFFGSAVSSGSDYASQAWGKCTEFFQSSSPSAS